MPVMDGAEKGPTSDSQGTTLIREGTKDTYTCSWDGNRPETWNGSETCQIGSVAAIRCFPKRHSRLCTNPDNGLDK
jgi:hypothetical protein